MHGVAERVGPRGAQRRVRVPAERGPHAVRVSLYESPLSPDPSLRGQLTLMKRSSRAWKKPGKQRWKWRKKKMRRRKRAQKMRKA